MFTTDLGIEAWMVVHLSAHRRTNTAEDVHDDHDAVDGGAGEPLAYAAVAGPQSEPCI